MSEHERRSNWLSVLVIVTLIVGWAYVIWEIVR